MSGPNNGRPPFPRRMNPVLRRMDLKLKPAVDLTESAMILQPVVTDDDAERIAREVIQSCEFLTHCFKAHGIEGYFDASEIEKMVKAGAYLGWKGYIAPVVQGKFKGVFTPEHILTITQVAYRYFEDMEFSSDDWTNDQLRNILVWGSCQGAKTMIFSGCFMILPVMENVISRHCGHDRIAIPVINTPNQKNLAVSSRKELESILNLYGGVRFVCGQYSEPLSYVINEILDKHLQSPEDATKTIDDFVLQRNRTNIKKFCSMSAKEYGGKVVGIHLEDEIHHGNGVGSMLDKTLEKFQEENPGVLARQIGVTATPAELLSQNKWTLVRMWMPDKGYMGITKYCGMELPTISGKRPPVQKFLCVEDEFPNDDGYEDTKAYEDITYFADKRELDLEDPWTLEAHMEYKSGFADWVFAAYHDSVDYKHPIFFLRPFRTVENCRDLLGRLTAICKKRNLEESHRFLPYFDTPLHKMFGPSTRRRTLREVLIDNFIRAKTYCLVIATDGRSNMGDSFPAECGYYMDLFDDRGNWDIFVQSTAGRSGGFGKDSTCYFRRGYWKWLTQFIVNDCYDTRKPFNNRTAYPDKKRAAGQPGSYKTYVFPYNGDH